MLKTCEEKNKFTQTPSNTANQNHGDKPGGGTSQYNEHFRLRERSFLPGERERLRPPRRLCPSGERRERPRLLLRERSRDLFLRVFPRSPTPPLGSLTSLSP